jgi:hypothetical protein
MDSSYNICTDNYEVCPPDLVCDDAARDSEAVIARFPMWTSDFIQNLLINLFGQKLTFTMFLTHLLVTTIFT